jgi:hypothetical protein
MSLDVKVGDKVFVVKKVYRSGAKPETRYEEVTKVGRKYFFTGSGHYPTKFSLEDGHEAGEGNYKDRAYQDESVYHRHLRRDVLTREISSRVRNWTWNESVPTEKLEIIYQILKEHE